MFAFGQVLYYNPNSNTSKLQADLLGSTVTTACPVQHSLKPCSHILTDCDI